jgi:DNA-binding response OmpR family regulator
MLLFWWQPFQKPKAQPNLKLEGRMKTILIVDDKPSLTRMLQDFLSAEGFRTVIADNGRNAIYTARHSKPDLILLDLMMPEMDGYEFMKVYRQESNTPVIMLTSRGGKENAVVGLEAGADDYVVKPFDLDELLARIRAILRRSEAANSPKTMLRFADLELDPELRMVRKNAEVQKFTPSEFAILERLMSYPGKVFSRLDLLECLEGGLTGESMERTVDVHIRKIRMKIEDNPAQPRYLETVFGMGYRLVEP